MSVKSVELKIALDRCALATITSPIGHFLRAQLTSILLFYIFGIFATRAFGCKTFSLNQVLHTCVKYADVVTAVSVMAACGITIVSVKRVSVNTPNYHMRNTVALLIFLLATTDKSSWKQTGKTSRWVTDRLHAEQNISLKNLKSLTFLNHRILWICRKHLWDASLTAKNTGSGLVTYRAPCTVFSRYKSHLVLSPRSFD